MSSLGNNEPTHEVISSDSDSKKGSTSGAIRRRTSRAGTRSVSTLSAAQLERKRANDREAQRAIRQRTKEHIEQLEKRIVELSSDNETSEQLVVTLKRNKELEEENTSLKARLEQVTISLGITDSGETSRDDMASASSVSSHSLQMPDQQQNVPNATVSPTTLSRTETAMFRQTFQWQAANSPLATGYVDDWNVDSGRTQYIDGFNTAERSNIKYQAPPYPFMFDSPGQAVSMQSATQSLQFPTMHTMHEHQIQAVNTPMANGPPPLLQYGTLLSEHALMQHNSSPPEMVPSPAQTQEQQIFYGYYPPR